LLTVLGVSAERLERAGVCCQSIFVCPNQVSGADCCNIDETCQIDELGNGTCVLRH
jgi:hypothetical protein